MLSLPGIAGPIALKWIVFAIGNVQSLKVGCEMRGIAVFEGS